MVIPQIKHTDSIKDGILYFLHTIATENGFLNTPLQKTQEYRAENKKNKIPKNILT